MFSLLTPEIYHNKFPLPVLPGFVQAVLASLAAQGSCDNQIPLVPLLHTSFAIMEKVEHRIRLNDYRFTAASLLL